MTHFTDKSNWKIQGYDVITCDHSDNRAHGRAAVVVKSSIKYYKLPSISMLQIQSSGVLVMCGNSELVIYAIYCPPRYRTKV